MRVRCRRCLVVVTEGGDAGQLLPDWQGLVLWRAFNSGHPCTHLRQNHVLPVVRSRHLGAPEAPATSCQPLPTSHRLTETLLPGSQSKQTTNLASIQRPRNSRACGCPCPRYASSRPSLARSTASPLPSSGRARSAPPYNRRKHPPRTRSSRGECGYPGKQRSEPLELAA